jgi:hypothetical protein
MRIYWPVTYQWIYANHIENSSCDTDSTVACVYFGRYLEMRLYVTVFLCRNVSNSHKMRTQCIHIEVGEWRGGEEDECALGSCPMEGLDFTRE